MQLKSRRTGRPSKVESGNITELIQRTAMQMFLERGFGDTSMDALAKQLRVSKATLYGRFPSKAAMLEAGVADLAQRLIPPHFECDGEAPFMTRMLQVVEFLLDIALLPETIALERLAMAESYRFPQLAIIVQEKGNLAVIRALKDFLDDAVSRGEIRPIDTGLLAEHIQDINLIFIRRAAHGIGSLKLDAENRGRLRGLISLVFDEIVVH